MLDEQELEQENENKLIPLWVLVVFSIFVGISFGFLISLFGAPWSFIALGLLSVLTIPICFMISKADGDLSGLAAFFVAIFCAFPFLVSMTTTVIIIFKFFKAAS